MSQLKVYKASAGSGKTFRLTVEYMKLALTNESNYRHILAVTFTNKATAEMKSRIVGELFRISKGEHTAYTKILMQELNWPALKVKQQAGLVLKKILHDYSRFTISTIDSFFQRVIKSFNRELGINAAYNMELDEMSIMEEAVERLIQSVEYDKELLNWLESFAYEKIKDGKGWNLKKDIIGLGSEIFNETFKSLSDDLHARLNDRSFLKDYKKTMGRIIAQYESQLKSFGQEGLNIMSLEGVTFEDFKSKKSGPAAGFAKMKALNFTPNPTTVKSTTELSAWVTQSTKEPLRSRLERIAGEKLMPKMQEAVNYVQTHLHNYNTAKLINSQLYTLGILVDLRKTVKEICREKGVILISDSGHLLKTVIADSETPFVYEKTGSVFSHFMIDEFQDTSGLQWNNFRPLIANSLSENSFSMVVGDVKQAIYRWRSGDWRLLANQLKDNFPAFGIQNENLTSNWRSHGQIIRFNNTLFNRIPELLQQHIDEDLLTNDIAENPVGISIQEVYANSIQEISNNETIDSGYVRVKFIEKKTDQKENNQELIFSELLSSVKLLQDQGVKASEMAILVRTKAEARDIADFFLLQKSLPENSSYQFNILSGESLFIARSEITGFIISVITGLLNPDDQVVKAETNFLYYCRILPQLEATGRVPVLADELQEKASDPEGLDAEIYSDQQIHRPFDEIIQPDNELMLFLGSKGFHEMITGKPIPEIVYNICEKFKLFSLTNELAYIQAFIDQISVFERNHSSELSNFIEWWSQNGEQFTIPVSDSIDAITVLTIHKSKGLEFNHVFVPFFDWSIQPGTAGKAPLLWCRPEVAPFNELELVPIRYKLDVGNSIFYREFYSEKINTYIDNLNLMYVVFTRAKAGLWVWAGYSEKRFTTIGGLLKLMIEIPASPNEHILNPDQITNLISAYHPELQTIEIGKPLYFPEREKQENLHQQNVKLTEFEFTDFRKFLKIKKQGEDFFSIDDKRKSGINKGKLIHEVLSLIETTNDLDSALKRIAAEGKLGSVPLESLRTELLGMLNDPEVKSWFDGSFRIINERNILTGVNGVKRPDRIMISGEKVVVVDYKSGEKESDKYKSQLRTYLRELKNCGYTHVTGYLWYTRTNTRVPVELKS